MGALGEAAGSSKGGCPWAENAETGKKWKIKKRAMTFPQPQQFFCGRDIKAGKYAITASPRNPFKRSPGNLPQAGLPFFGSPGVRASLFESLGPRGGGAHFRAARLWASQTDSRLRGIRLGAHRSKRPFPERVGQVPQEAIRFEKSVRPFFGFLASLQHGFGCGQSFQIAELELGAPWVPGRPFTFRVQKGPRSLGAVLEPSAEGLAKSAS